MDFAFSREQEEFRASVRRFLRERAPSEVVRTAVDRAGGHDPALWRQLCQQFDLPALRVPEEYGGAGFGLLETAIAVEELGRALTPVPLLPAALGIEAIMLLGGREHKRDLLPALASGERIAVLAFGEQDAASAAHGVTAAADGDRVRLSGVKRHVPYGHVADVLLVPAAAGAGTGLYVVDAATSGVVVTAQPTLDLTRPMATVELDGAGAMLLGGSDWGRVIDVARALLACEMVGGGQACLEMATEYAKQRVQFDRPIGSFQAVKHRCAEMAVALDGARAAAQYAVLMAHGGGDELSTAALIAKVEAAEAFRFCASWSLQVHGGIGFTWEHDAHLYLRRAKADEALFGDRARHHELLATAMGL